MCRDPRWILRDVVEVATWLSTFFFLGESMLSRTTGNNIGGARVPTNVISDAISDVANDVVSDVTSATLRSR